GGGVRFVVGRGVGIGRAAGLGAGFAGDLLARAGVGPVFQEPRRGLLLLDLRDDGGDVLRRRLGFGRDSLRRREAHAVSILEITEGAVAGDDAAAIGGEFGKHLAPLALQRRGLGGGGRGHWGGGGVGGGGAG